MPVHPLSRTSAWSNAAFAYREAKALKSMLVGDQITAYHFTMKYHHNNHKPKKALENI